MAQRRLGEIVGYAERTRGYGLDVMRSLREDLKAAAEKPGKE